MPLSLRRLLGDRRFGPLFWTQALGAFNDNIFKNALVLLITFRSVTLLEFSPEKLVALCGAVFILPFFLFSALAGQLADQRSKSTLARFTKVWEIAVMLFSAAAFALDSVPLLLFTLFMLGTQSTFFGPIKYGILPELLRPQELTAGNALVELGTFISILLGTIAGGLLMATGDTGPYWVSGIGITLSVVGWLASRKIPPQSAQSPELKISFHPVRPTLELFRLAREVPSVFLTLLAISWFWLLGSIILSVLPPLSKTTLGSTESVLTFFLAIFSIGIGVGSVLCEKLSFRTLELGLVPIGSIGMSVFTLDIGVMALPAASTLGTLLSSSAGWRLTGDLFLFSVSAGFFTVPLYTLMQLRSDPRSRSRIIAANNVLNAFFMVAGALVLVGFYAAGLSPQKVFIALAVGNGLVAFWTYFVLPEFFYRFVLWMTAHTLYRLRIRGSEHFPETGAAVLVCNHVSFVDWMIISAACPRPIRFVMDHEFTKLPGLGFFFRHAKTIPITSLKSNPRIHAAAFEAVSAELRSGQLVCIFPEGEITKTGEMTFFRRGIEQILARDPVPVIPMALGGMWGSFFSRRYGRAMSRPFRRVWAKLTLTVGPPIPADRASAKMAQDAVSELLGVP